MKYIPIILIWFWACTAAFAASVQTTVSVGIVDVASMTQTTEGDYILSGSIAPLYCTSDSNGTMCYY